ncbi:TPA: DUF550 domain-containing protein [Salmonella enterica]|nr:DUF550 domain-containing protein [Salmonella enterica]HCJ3539965.1 DUF550 domain-containing protein [Salmonella enterica]HCJ3546993.1 DUF550 domain-containing protein [Salmonella enterica]
MTTYNHQSHGPVSLDRLHQISEILSKAAAQSDGGNLGYAMADAVKVIAGVFAHELVRREHAVWSQATFGDVGPVGPLKHLSKEALEAAADPSDPLEWADMQFLLWDAQRRMGISDEFITRAMIEKLEINKSRQWPEPKDGEPRLHIKEQSAPVIPGGWISCSDRMPEKGQNVLISVNFDSSLVEPLICSARYTGSTFRRGDATIKPGNGIEQATHWMPLTAAGGEVMNNLMIDLETMGKNKDAPIVSIGAVFFTPETGDIGQEFYTVVSLESAMGQGATPDGDTILWWLKQSPEARAAICIDDTLSISDALSELNHFINRHAANTKYLKVWGNGATFDNVILRGAYERAGQICPWAYWNDHDVRTIVTLGRSIGFDPKMDIPFDGERHNALADARHQAKYVSAIWQKLIPATSTEL